MEGMNGYDLTRTQIGPHFIVISIDVRLLLGERLLKLCGLKQDQPVCVRIYFEEGNTRFKVCV